MYLDDLHAVVIAVHCLCFSTARTGENPDVGIPQQKFAHDPAPKITGSTGNEDMSCHSQIILKHAPQDGCICSGWFTLLMQSGSANQRGEGNLACQLNAAQEGTHCSGHSGLYLGDIA